MTDWLTDLAQAEQLFDQNQFDDAVRLAQGVLRVQPDCALAHQVLGLVASRRNDLDEALPRLRHARSIRPDLVPSHHDLGMVFMKRGDLANALRCFERALYLDPAHKFSRFSRALAWLKLGRYRDGWAEYEWRWQAAAMARPEIPRPRWDGSPLNGRSILVHSEQGMGDTVQFIRFLPRLRQQAGRVSFGCQKSLSQLLRGIDGVDAWIPIDEPFNVDFDLYTPLCSLPTLLGMNDEANFAMSAPYVQPCPIRVERWKPRLDALPGLPVGIGWQGSSTFNGDALRSIPLEQFTPLTAAGIASFVCLQKLDGLNPIDACRDRIPLTVFDDLDADGAFVDTAAIMQHLDPVITSDTALAHVAGAVGVPVWLLLSTASDWRWLTERSDSPWYPSMRLFRQSSPGDWSGVFRDVAEAFEHRSSG